MPYAQPPEPRKVLLIIPALTAMFPQLGAIEATIQDVVEVQSHARPLRQGRTWGKDPIANQVAGAYDDIPGTEPAPNVMDPLVAVSRLIADAPVSRLQDHSMFNAYCAGVRDVVVEAARTFIRHRPTGYQGAYARESWKAERVAEYAVALGLFNDALPLTEQVATLKLLVPDDYAQMPDTLWDRALRGLSPLDVPVYEMWRDESPQTWRWTPGGAPTRRPAGTSPRRARSSPCASSTARKCP